GPAGAAGPAGPAGPQGPQGAQGPIGPSNAYEVYRDSGPANIPSTPTTVATLSNLPAGAYAITAKAELDIAATDGLPAPRILCQVNAAGDFDDAVAQGEEAGGLAMSATLPVEVTHTFSGTGTVTLSCNKNGSPHQVDVNWAKIIAIRLGSEQHTAVTG
ncbi:MAG: hypothetical protein ACXVSL_08825, partial [Solirubrobacteraceae bacterium]